ncbi:hypothetical protein HKX23_17240 [Sulfitobacter sp. KE29]|uniref:hypothetical protein n=2 Tax=Sulfitobacter TaxID=60136 RepID=UPI000ADDE985|nr:MULTISPECIES: hypothetical protein [unclassified Sulfitobacter]MBO9439017.1 hypothetical protein [Sulfitobacter sp. R18_2]MDF3420100.1 hypothetical protein [Sulfitobacter sp. Ks38]MDF3427585.1 hypothetical protein [Sulfitobacter sp. KE29]MDF3431164.1 hypothetical protein [Sulfitobacter sp. S46]MDF3445937.1 hypothetical protein [Sulfitobacter sp. KE31]
MARVAHIPYLEKRPSGYFFRRRLPKSKVGIENPDPRSALCLSLRTDVLSEATSLVRALTAHTDLVVALMTERPVDHLSSEQVTLLTELARFQIAAHEALRASAEPRSEMAANFAAKAEHTIQDMLRRALALGDRTPVIEPLREVARHMGLSLDQASENWRTLAFEALRVMLDVSRERERREVGSYDEPTPIFRLMLASRATTSVAAFPAPSSQIAVLALAIPTINASGATPAAPEGMPMVEASAGPKAIATVQAQSEPAVISTPREDAAPVAQMAPTLERNAAVSSSVAEHDDTAFRIKVRPPRLGNIDLRDLTPETRKVLENKLRGITLLEGIRLMKELKCAGYGDKFSVAQTGDEAAGERWKKGSGSKANVCEKFWVEFVGDVPFEDADPDAIRDAMKILAQLPHQHSKGTVRRHIKWDIV